MIVRRPFLLLPALVAGILSWSSTLRAQPALDDGSGLRPKILIAALGCTGCHRDPDLSNPLPELVPDLSQAGLRYQPSYLFEFLQNPVPVRRHLGPARMPDFHLTREEALALTLFLETQTRETLDDAEIPESARQLWQQPPGTASSQGFRDLWQNGELQCLNCHLWQGRGGAVGVELADTGHRLRSAWMKRYLLDPAVYGVPSSLMPAQFFAMDESQVARREMVPDAAAKIQTLIDHFYRVGAPRRLELEQRWASARAAFPDITASQGERLFRALNCAGCHRHPDIPPRADHAAPDLRDLGRGTLASWLTDYLRHSTAVRPAGYQPGQGGRMPDFALGADEAGTATEFLLAERAVQKDRTQDLKLPEPLSAFSMRKAETLLEEKLSCLGCHAWKGRGGSMAPDLTEVRRRRTPAYIAGIVRNPRQLAPHSIMPRHPMPEATARLLTGLLLQTTAEIADGSTRRYLSPLQNAVGEVSDGSDTSTHPGRSNYAKYCAGCHGATGRGDGFNAGFLPVTPTLHADAAVMSQRPDDTLFDGVHAGGHILNKSPLMPPWGQTLSAEEIRELVAYMRTLCDCQGPAWSRDGEAR